jgi:hypothetical protein
VQLSDDTGSENRVLAHDRLIDPFRVLARGVTLVLAHDRLIDPFRVLAHGVNRVLAHDRLMA